jgi:Protein of unknown function (DUF3800)
MSTIVIGSDSPGQVDTSVQNGSRRDPTPTLCVLASLREPLPICAASRVMPRLIRSPAVRRLFDKKLHTRPAFEVIFASRGKARTRSIREHLLKAQKYSRKADGSYPDAKIHVRAMPSHQHAGLQLTDYCLWALQRLFTKGEDRFLGLIWPKVGLIVDADDISEKPYGTYHTRKRSPMTAEPIKNRKVED